MMDITFEFATRDDCLDKMVPSDLRQVVAERDRLRTRVAELEEFIRNAPVSTGICCCGESMDSHEAAIVSGHMPIDQWEPAVASLLGAPK